VILEGLSKGSQHKTIQVAEQNIHIWYNKIYRLPSSKGVDYQPMWWRKNPRHWRDSDMRSTTSRTRAGNTLTSS